MPLCFWSDPEGGRKILDAEPGNEGMNPTQTSAISIATETLTSPDSSLVKTKPPISQG
jgi:hypothetical protein